VLWFNERYEFLPVDVSLVFKGVRGSEQRVIIESGNPWSPLNEYIKYCIERLPFNHFKLEK